eukprot:COSAG05_NODE_2849_length_2574_cov_3.581818_3_plen_288_part_01
MPARARNHQVLDMSMARLGEMMSSDSRSHIANFLGLQDYFPEMLGKMLIVNAPKILTLVWDFVSPMLDARTKAKITICPPGARTRCALQELIHPSQLPRFLGGGEGDAAGPVDGAASAQHAGELLHLYLSSSLPCERPRTWRSCCVVSKKARARRVISLVNCSTAVCAPILDTAVAPAAAAAALRLSLPPPLLSLQGLVEMAPSPSTRPPSTHSPAWAQTRRVSSQLGSEACAAVRSERAAAMFSRRRCSLPRASRSRCESASPRADGRTSERASERSDKMRSAHKQA